MTIDRNHLTPPDPPAQYGYALGPSAAWRDGWVEGAFYGLQQRDREGGRAKWAEAEVMRYARTFLAVADLMQRWEHAGLRQDGSVTGTARHYAAELRETLALAGLPTTREGDQARLTPGRKPWVDEATLRVVAAAAESMAMRIDALASSSKPVVQQVAGAWASFAEELRERAAM